MRTNNLCRYCREPSVPEVCSYCRRWGAKEIPAVAGRWVKRPGSAGISDFVPDDKSDALNPVNECSDCGGFLLPNSRCDTCLTWAVKNARDHQWAQMSWANRGVIWTVLDRRNSVSEEAA